jgi:organic radical activating enzyme
MAKGGAMKMRSIFPAWGRILLGYKPFLSIEITKECPLHCPGCYAYEPGHLNNGSTIRQLTDLRGDDLVEGVMRLIRRFRPLHLSIVGGDPLVRFRELEALLPKLEMAGIEVQLTTSAFRPIPVDWAKLSCLHLVISVDGLQEEHDARRAPATYARVLKNIEGHQIIVHCTITRQLLSRESYLHDFSSYWSGRPEVRRIWFSLFTPQEDDATNERLTPHERSNAIRLLADLRSSMPKVHLPEIVLEGYRNPPSTPAECIFARTTNCVSADLATRVAPCQIGGKPICAECGCLASAGMAAIGRYRLAGMLRLSDIFTASEKIGSLFQNGKKPLR